MLFTFEICNEFDPSTSFFCEGSDIIDAMMKADVFAKDLDEKLNAAFPERDKGANTVVQSITIARLKRADADGINKYVEEMKETAVFEDEED